MRNATSAGCWCARSSAVRQWLQSVIGLADSWPSTTAWVRDALRRLGLNRRRLTASRSGDPQAVLSEKEQGKCLILKDHPELWKLLGDRMGQGQPSGGPCP